VSIAYGHPGGMGSKVWDHDDWTVVDGPGVNFYAQSKTLAERAGEMRQGSSNQVSATTASRSRVNFPSDDAFRSLPAAWDLIRGQAESRGLELATVNPSFVQGPMLTSSSCSSVDLVGQILLGKMPGLPNAYMSTVDVRDVAEAHVRAMVIPEAAGKRFPVSATEVRPPATPGRAPPPLAPPAAH